MGIIVGQPVWIREDIKNELDTMKLCKAQPYYEQIGQLIYDFKVTHNIPILKMDCKKFQNKIQSYNMGVSAENEAIILHGKLPKY